MAKKIQSPEDNAVATRTATSVAEIPEHLREFANMGNVGLENVRTADTIMPRLAIAQSMSPQRQRGDTNYIDGLEEGNFFNTISNEIYGDSVIVTPLFYFPSRIYFTPRGAQGPQQLCGTRILDPAGELIEGPITPQGCRFCEHSKFLDVPRQDGSIRPNCTFFMNFVVGIHKPEGIEPAVFSAKSKMIKPAKKWNSMMRSRVPRLPAFTMQFALRTNAEKAPKGTFFNFVPDNAGHVNAEALKTTKVMFEMFSNMDIKVDTRDLDREPDLENHDPSM